MPISVQVTRGLLTPAGESQILPGAARALLEEGRTFVNVTYAVDGAWGIAGKAYANQELGDAIQRSAR